MDINALGQMFTIDSKDATGKRRRQSGLINQCIEDKKIEKAKIESLKLDINKIEMEC